MSVRGYAASFVAIKNGGFTIINSRQFQYNFIVFDDKDPLEELYTRFEKFDGPIKIREIPLSKIKMRDLTVEECVKLIKDTTKDSDNGLFTTY